MKEEVDAVCLDGWLTSGTDLPEIVCGEGRTRAEVVGMVEPLVQCSPNVIVTRTDVGTFGEVRNVCTEAEWHEAARLIRIWRDRKERGLGEIAVVTSQTEGVPVAEEAALIAETMGNFVQRVWDIRRTNTTEQEPLQRARVIIVVANVDEPLPAILRESASVPVVLVPRAAGSRDLSSKSAAVANMLGSCAANVTFVGPDRGAQAGFVAGLINRRWPLPEK